VARAAAYATGATARRRTISPAGQPGTAAPTFPRYRDRGT